MAAIFECQECGHQAIYKQEDGLEKCPECGDIHVDVTYGIQIKKWALSPQLGRNQNI